MTTATDGRHAPASDHDVLLRIRDKVTAMERAEAAYLASRAETRRLKAEWEEARAQAGAFVRAAVAPELPLFAEARLPVPPARVPANRVEDAPPRGTLVCASCKEPCASLDGANGECIACGRRRAGRCVRCNREATALYTDGCCTRCTTVLPSPRCAKCGVSGGRVVDLPSQADADDTLIMADQIDCDCLQALGVPEQGCERAHVCGRCFGGWVVEQNATEPAPKPKKKRKGKLPPVPPEVAAEIHEHLCPNGPQTPLPEAEPKPDERPWEACKKCGGTGRVCKKCKRGEGRVSLKQEYCGCPMPDFDLCGKCGGNGREYLKPKKPRKAPPLPDGIRIVPAAKPGPVVGLCPNCGVRVDDDQDSPDALCDLCRFQAKQKAAATSPAAR